MVKFSYDGINNIKDMVNTNELKELGKLTKTSFTRERKMGFTKLINYILNDKYKLSFEFVPWIMISLTITSFYGLFVQFIYTKKKTFGLGIITFSGSLLQLAITYALISAFGKDGIKYSLVIGSLFIMLGVWIYSDKVYPLPWFSKKWLL